MNVSASDIHKEIGANVECVNGEFQGDVVFVTDLDNPLKFRCRLNTNALDLPEGYLPAPAKYQWSTVSGRLEADNDVCRWLSLGPGLQVIQVNGSITFVPPASSSMLDSPQPKIVCHFTASKSCLVPLKVDYMPDGKIHGFEIGKYPDPFNPDDRKKASTPSRILAHAEIYMPPKLFYAVTPETYFLRIFKNYTLGEFDLDPRFMDLEYPRYIALDPKLLKKMDMLHELMAADGVPVTKFNIIYGFRSPAYNIGSWKKDGDETLKEPFSAHMYGLAVDFIVDEDGDYVMDDLNGDGKIDATDAVTLRRYVDKLDHRLLEQKNDLVGGAGYYYHHDFWERGEYAQSPYVHMDIRGYTREDGTLIRWVGKDTIGVQNMSNPYRPKTPLPANPLLNP